MTCKGQTGNGEYAASTNRGWFMAGTAMIYAKHLSEGTWKRSILHQANSLSVIRTACPYRELNHPKQTDEAESL